MTTLVTLFAISLVGIVFTLAFKLAEEKTGKALFLPDKIMERDDEIKRQTLFLWQKFILLLKHKTKILLHIVYTGTHSSVARIANSRLQRNNGKILKRKGSSSFFLKHITEHKNDMRRNGGNDG